MATKLVKIPHMGPIYAKGGVHGPIMTPYNEEVSTVGLMVMGGVSVVEVLKDGSELPLTITNFDQVNDIVVNTPSTPEPVKEKRAEEVHVAPPTTPAEEVKEPVVQPQQPKQESKKEKFRPDQGKKK